MAKVEFHVPAVLLLNHPICFNSDKSAAGWSYETYPKIIDLRKLPGFPHATNIFTFHHFWKKVSIILKIALKKGDMLDPLSSTFWTPYKSHFQPFQKSAHQKNVAKFDFTPQTQNCRRIFDKDTMAKVKILKSDKDPFFFREAVGSWDFL